MAKMYIISEALVQKIANYLMRQPYLEVVKLIQEVGSLKEKSDKKDKEDAKT